MSQHQRFSTYLTDLSYSAKHELKPIVEGRLIRMIGMTLEAIGLDPVVGQRCMIIHNDVSAEAEVIGFEGNKTFLMPIENIQGLKAGARVRPIPTNHMIPVGPQMLGRVIDATGKPLDSKGEVACADLISLEGEVINPLDRHPIEDTLDVGIRCINSLLTVGQGQRMGLFAGSGVGKSVLLGMMTRFTEADVVVVGLIGERGREVKEFIIDILGEEGLKRAVVVASPADDTPLKRLRAAKYCTAIAEYFRDQGKNVLLLMDSLTRYAQAQREIALSVGEPPATKGYPPSVFAKIPQLVERAGNGRTGGGSITAFYTVLTEGDDLQDPVADSARAILDGHVVLSRKIAEEGCYPAIDIEASISRAMANIIEPDRLKQVLNFKQLYSKYNDNKDFVQIGAYTSGTDPKLDIAIQMYPTMLEFIKQGIKECQDMPASIEALGMMQQMADTLENQILGARQQGQAPQGQTQQVQAGQPPNAMR